MSELLVLLAAFAAIAVARQRRHRHLPARAVIVSPRKSTTIAKDGAVRSVQSAEITMAKTDLDRMWTPTNLENLARTYWRFLSRMTLGLIRVVYGSNERSVVFLTRPLNLLRFKAPEYVLEPNHGNVRWQIRGGLLVARRGRKRGCGYLSLDVRRSPEVDANGQAKLHIEVEVANFYPSIAAGFSTPVYEATQSAIHVLVTHAFLRSLAKLDLATSKIGRLSMIVPARFRQSAPGSRRRPDIPTRPNIATRADIAPRPDSATPGDIAPRPDSATPADIAPRPDSATRADIAPRADAATRPDTAPPPEQRHPLPSNQP